MAYEMLVGQVPFHDTETPVAILLQHVNEPPPPAVEIDPDLDPHLAAWVERMLAKDPTDRTRRASAGLGRARGDRDRPARAALAPRRPGARA